MQENSVYKEKSVIVNIIRYYAIVTTIQVSAIVLRQVYSALILVNDSFVIYPYTYNHDNGGKIVNKQILFTNRIDESTYTITQVM